MGQNRDQIGTKNGKIHRKLSTFSTVGQLYVRLNRLFSLFNFFHKLCGTPAQCAGQRDTGVNLFIYNNKVSHLAVPLPGPLGHFLPVKCFSLFSSRLARRQAKACTMTSHRHRYKKGLTSGDSTPKTSPGLYAQITVCRSAV
jgi:hypothetical protein